MDISLNFIIAVLSIVLLVLISFSCMRNYARKRVVRIPIAIKTAKDIPGLFPSKSKEIEDRVQQSIQEAQKIVDTIIEIPDNQRTFENTARALDNLGHLSPLAITSNIIGALKLVSPDESVRNACQDAILKISQFALENITNNKALYAALKAYAEGNAKREALSDEETYFLKKNLEDYKRRGLELPDEQLKQNFHSNKKLK